MMVMTSIGDGFFPVRLDLDASGILIAIHVAIDGDD
jgi:hypothetical protein